MRSGYSGAAGGLAGWSSLLVPFVEWRAFCEAVRTENLSVVPSVLGHDGDV